MTFSNEMVIPPGALILRCCSAVVSQIILGAEPTATAATQHQQVFFPAWRCSDSRYREREADADDDGRGPGVL